MSVGAVIVAAGIGRRFGSHVRPKPYASLGGRPLLCYSLDVFERLSDVSSIAVVIHPEHRELFSRVVDVQQYSKLRHVVIGGRERQDSTWSGLEAISRDGVDIVAVHDAARPFPPPAAIEQAIDAARRGVCAILAAPVTDTIKEGDDSGHAVRTLDRSRLWAAQTPQVAPLAILREALELARKENRLFTDEAAAVEHSGGRVLLIPSTPENMKITLPADLELAEYLLRNRLQAEHSSDQPGG
ncbi:MAG: 2-C-methyl-D-erythritol 4-phosphate cytidylyltransferase [Candidatus Sumerlaeia bacterium]